MQLQRTEPGQKRKAQSMWKGFVQGSVGAAVGGSCAHPLDLIKVRMQLQTETPKLNMKQMGGENEAPLSMLAKVVCAAGSGAIGAFAGNPGDLAMVRMQADGKLPIDQRRNYRNIFDAVGKIAKTEGVLSMWRTGVVPNMNRAAIITVGQLAAYDQCKQVLLQTGFKDGIQTHFSASFMAAFIASVMSNSVDVAKTRLMNQRAEA